MGTLYLPPYRLVLPVAEGVDTHRWLIERGIRLLEGQLRAWAAEPNPPLARAEIVQQLEDQVCQLYEELETIEGLPRPIDVARDIERLTEQEFHSYLNRFQQDEVIGWAARLADCPIALYIMHGTMIRTHSLRLRVFLDHVLVDDGFDEVRAELPPWAQRVTRATTPPEYPGAAGEAVTVQYLHGLLDVRAHGG